MHAPSTLPAPCGPAGTTRRGRNHGGSIVPAIVRAIVSVAAFVMACSAVHVQADDPPTKPTVAMPKKHQAFLRKHCTKCHSSETQEGGVSLDDIPFTIVSVEAAERWQKVLGVLNAGEMPPKEQPQPESDAKMRMLEDLSKMLVKARTALADQGRVSLVRRLNRREYKHTIRDLLGVDVDANSLPSDANAGSYDTIGSGLFMSSDQFEQYLAIGRTAIDAAASDWPQPESVKPERTTQRTEVETAARKQISGLLNGYFLTGYKNAMAWKESGGKSPKEFGLPDEQEANFRIMGYQKNAPYLEHYLSAPKSDSGAWLMYPSGNFHDTEPITIPAKSPSGDYVLRLRLAAADDAPAARRFIEVGQKGAQDTFELIDVFHVTGTLDKPQILEVPVTVTPNGRRTWVFREKRYNDGSAEGLRNGIQRSKDGIGLPLALWIDWVEWEGPLPRPSSLVGEEVFGGLPKKGNESAIAKTILQRFARLAFRGAVPSQDFLGRLVDLYEARRKAGDEPHVAIREPMAVILASPGFLYLADPLAERGDTEPDERKDAADASGSRRLSDRELATRLSYFLWAAAPDKELLRLAASGDLRKPDVLARQVDRLISDPKSRDFASGFVHQWLSIDRLDFFRFDGQLYPDFPESTRDAAKQEVYETFHYLLEENLPARSLLASDFVVVNALMASYYELTDAAGPIEGDRFRKVSLPAGSPRGGLLGMAAILAMGSNGLRTSPVERGAWVMRKVLNDPPPPAPPNVPQLARLEGKPMATRERLRMHQEQPQCAQCHRTIDPIGFGLENFDAAGQWRTEEHAYKLDWVVNTKKDWVHGKVVTKSWPIEPAGTLPDGAAFKDFFELREKIAARHHDAFVRGLIENLFSYALGRPVSFADGETIDAMAAAAKREGGVRSIVQRLVASEEFQTK